MKIIYIYICFILFVHRFRCFQVYDNLTKVIHNTFSQILITILRKNIRDAKSQLKTVSRLWVVLNKRKKRILLMSRHVSAAASQLLMQFCYIQRRENNGLEHRTQQRNEVRGGERCCGSWQVRPTTWIANNFIFKFYIIRSCDEKIVTYSTMKEFCIQHFQAEQALSGSTSRLILLCLI